MTLMINDWRRRWGQGDFPFLWAQLPNFKKRSDDPNAISVWAHTRESMAKTLWLPNTGMATTIDIGEARDIHPKNKQDVGTRQRVFEDRIELMIEKLTAFCKAAFVHRSTTGYQKPSLITSRHSLNYVMTA